MDELGPIVGFLGLFGGFMAIIFASIYATKVINRKFPTEAQASERLRDLENRVAELEERVDFSERLLAQAREQGSIPPPRDG
jgi:hypothetical protein